MCRDVSLPSQNSGDPALLRIQRTGGGAAQENMRPKVEREEGDTSLLVPSGSQNAHCLYVSFKRDSEKFVHFLVIVVISPDALDALNVVPYGSPEGLCVHSLLASDTGMETCTPDITSKAILYIIHMWYALYKGSGLY